MFAAASAHVEAGSFVLRAKRSADLCTLELIEFKNMPGVTWTMVTKDRSPSGGQKHSKFPNSRAAPYVALFSDSHWRRDRCPPLGGQVP